VTQAVVHAAINGFGGQSIEHPLAASCANLPNPSAPSMTPQGFIAKWQRANLSERSAAQQHFLDLCDLLGQPKPAAADPKGAWYTFERGVQKTGGGNGWADVWMRQHFAWEYKRK
jgi:hypothetical protein